MGMSSSKLFPASHCRLVPYQNHIRRVTLSRISVILVPAQHVELDSHLVSHFGEIHQCLCAHLPF